MNTLDEIYNSIKESEEIIFNTYYELKDTIIADELIEDYERLINTEISLKLLFNDFNK